MIFLTIIDLWYIQLYTYFGIYFLQIFYLDHISTKKGMNLRFNAYSPRINEWGDDEVSRMKRKIKTLGGYDDPKVRYIY